MLYVHLDDVAVLGTAIKQHCCERVEDVALNETLQGPSAIRSVDYIELMKIFGKGKGRHER